MKSQNRAAWNNLGHVYTNNETSCHAVPYNTVPNVGMDITVMSESFIVIRYT
jgi:hypothetical protein